MGERVAVIIGGGPAGLTAAYELLIRSDIRPIVLEKLDRLGGFARTEQYKGNRIDIGGHRFFSKSERVMQRWFELLPLQKPGRQPTDGDPEDTDRVMLVRSRKSRIYFLRRFFDYPISLSGRTLKNLGLVRVARIAASYAWARLRPIRNEQNLEQFFINRFGRELYRTFFQSYTEKVWGVPCTQISAAWGAQRIKGLSITQAVLHVLRRPFRRADDVAQKGTETSLIEQFLYPKLGPGQMWETCAERIIQRGGRILPHVAATRILIDGQRVTGVGATDLRTGERVVHHGDYFFSSMPVQELIRAIDGEVPAAVRAVSDGLVYRDFITVGLLLNRLKIRDEGAAGAALRTGGLLKDNWIYIQEPDVLVGRLQIFNNWSPALVADPSKVWVGLEYFCYETDALWKLSDQQMIELAKEELAKIGIIDAADVLDGTVIRVPNTYPAYFGTYDQFDVLREYLDRFENLFLVGRNGMHRYNNQDHSMLTAMTAVDNILAGRADKANIWDVNAEQEYHEEK